MRPIKIVENVIEIPFEKDGKVVETLYFDKSDDAMQRMLKQGEKVTSSAKIADTEDQDQIERTRVVLKEAYDDIFGEGSFDKIYKINPSVAIMTNYLVEIMNGIFAEMMESMTTQTLSNYLKSGAKDASDTKPNR